LCTRGTTGILEGYGGDTKGIPGEYQGNTKGVPVVYHRMLQYYFRIVTNTSTVGKPRYYDSKVKLKPGVKRRYSSGNTEIEGILRNPSGIPREKNHVTPKGYHAIPEEYHTKPEYYRKKTMK